MLNELHIENIAVIERADIAFTKGFNVLTGETGAGKSIVIDSIGAVLGDRVSRELVRRGAEKGVVTASFDVDGCEHWLEENEIDVDDELIIQRRITAEGKSSCRVCGTPITTAQLKELGSLLVDIHGQNDGRQLMDEKRHMDYLDRFGELGEVLATYGACYRAYGETKKKIASLKMDEEEKERLRDSLTLRVEELEKAALKEGEYEEISSRLALLRNSEKLTENISNAYGLLYDGDDNAVSLAQNALYYTQRASAIAPELEAAVKSLNDAVFSLSDAAERLNDLREGLDFSPEEFDRLESRLALLNKLQRKYSREEGELIAYLDECHRKLDDLEDSDDRIQRLEKELHKQKAACLAEAEKLSALRREKAAELQIRIESELRELSMPSVRFMVEITDLDTAEGFNAKGKDEVRFLMAANAGEAAGRISHIASGGELSRIMLAMKNVFAEHDPVPTMIFDEIDTGVSGVAAQRVGEKLYCVSSGKQVMCVTHLPQIAAMADSHFVIAKSEHDGRTYTQVTHLDRAGRAQELARLHGGDNITALTLASAEEQLDAADKFKYNRAH